MPTIVFQVIADRDFARKISDPNFMSVYKAYVIREITEGALETVRSYAAAMWAAPTGGIDQSWFSNVDPARGLGFISNAKPYAYWLNYGVRPHKMTYLINAHNAYDIFYSDGGNGRAAVIPIKVRDRGSGGTIFRLATDRHMTRNPDGPPWWHPGIQPKHFLEEGMRQYREYKLRRDFEGVIIKILGM